MTFCTIRIVVWMLLLCALPWGALANETVTISLPQATVRALPGVTHPILTTVPQGGIFVVLETQDEWLKILLDDGRHGWIARSTGTIAPGGEAWPVEDTSRPRASSTLAPPDRDPRALGVVSATAPASGSERLALVIGNAAYGADLGALQNPTHDAEDMAATLRQLGFQVTLLVNATLPQMQETITTFSRQLRQGKLGLFYYAGHGVQVGGLNYLIPVNAQLVHATDVKLQTVAAEEVLESMEAARNPLNVVILDACRNNPFPGRWPAAKPGLAPMTAARGALIAYATSPGTTAADGTDRNGLYTQYLLQTLAVPGLLVEQVFKRVRIAVEDATQGKQVPWESSSLRGELVLHPEAETPSLVVPSPGASLGSPAVTSPQRPSVVPPATSPPAPAASREPVATLQGKDGAEMVLIPAGVFRMGTTPEEITAILRQHRRMSRVAFLDETPQHPVYLDAFYIDRYEVSNAHFQRFVEATGYQTQAEREGGGKIRAMGSKDKWNTVATASWRMPKGQGSTIAERANHPVVQVTWKDAQAYCQWAEKRLPTEAEWEKAARGLDGQMYPWGNEPDFARLNFCDRHCVFPERDANVDDGQAETAPVGSYASGKSPYGVYDMAGNVWEWVADWYEEKYYTRSPERNPRGPTTGSQVGLRGGSWLYPAPTFRVATRGGVPPDRRNNNIGFRCAKTP